MLKTLFRRNPASPSPPVSPATRLREMAGSPSADQAAAMLIGPAGLMQLSQPDASIVVGYMRPHRISQGNTFIGQGDADQTSFMLLILSGEVTVEAMLAGRAELATLTVLGPGDLVGELGLLDGESRTASCTATTEVHGAILTREALGRLLEEHPRVAAKLMMAIAVRITLRLRQCTDKLNMYARLMQAMQQEINRPTVL